MANIHEQLGLRSDEFMAPVQQPPVGNTLVSKVEFQRVVVPQTPVSSPVEPTVPMVSEGLKFMAAEIPSENPNTQNLLPQGKEKIL